ncbi:hypothetical protein O2W18_07230 [Modestobacter sp. VKM Ac-2983]|uniref:hypothetical protein n=1 Tax=Modestobacter sp. VKM Ac-2983 TaxID=3004137 RepID=UPI0022ABC131|nr:hypothetical protein [Modestobacter sp. VKM Ac-2983]MCZ2804885.1 hypothetical protein [Modestobacter sp. VKM Ac-2983]
MAPTAVEFSEVTGLVDALAWPVVVLILVLVFRRSLIGLLNRDKVKATLPGGVSLVARDPSAATDAVVDASASKGMHIDKALARREVEAATEDLVGLRRSPRLLWVDDHPSDNRHEIAAFEALGLTVDLATSTTDAVTRLALQGPFDAVISNLGRSPDPRAGYTLLDSLRQAGDVTPYAIYAGSTEPDDFDDAVRHGAVGSASDPTELIRLVRRCIRNTAARDATPRRVAEQPPEPSS